MNRKTCLKLDLVCICACVVVFLYLLYAASLQRDLRDVQLLLDPRPPAQDFCESSEKWIVVNATGSDAGDKLTTIPDVTGWRLLILDNVKHRTVLIRRCKNCVYVSDAADLATGWVSGFDIDPSLTPYIYLMKRGAKWVFYTDDYRDLHLQIRPFKTGRSSGLVADTKNIFSPISHFVNTGSKPSTSLYRVDTWTLPNIQTRWLPGSKYSTSEHACSALPVLLRLNVLGMADLSSSLYEYGAFWSLVSMTSNSSQLVWSLWKQRLLWEIKGSLALFQPGHCDRMSSITRSPEKEFDKESLKKLVVFLQKWKCTDNSSFFSCVQSLSREMRKLHYFTSVDVHIVNHWIEYLIEYDYKEPSLKRTHANGTGHTLVYSVTPSLTDHATALENPFNSYCKNYTKGGLSIPLNTKLFEDVVLIVSFSRWISHSMIKYLNFLYSRYFTHIVYCGQKLSNIMNVIKSYKKPLNFIEIQTENGEFGYRCSAMVMKMGFSVKGFLQISEDVLVNFKQLAKLPVEKPWFQSSVKTGNVSDTKIPLLTPTSSPFLKKWYGNHGVDKLRNLWRYMQRTLHDKPMVDFLQTMKQNTGRNDVVFHESSSIFYVPYKLKEKFSYFARMFARDSVCGYISVPTILHGISMKQDIVHMNGSYLLSKQVLEYKTHYRTNNHFLHPWKLPENNQTSDKKFFCDVYLPKNV